MTEAELVAGCMEQNRHAQRQLYDRYSTAMYTLAYRITGDFDTANDVLQDAFLDLFRQIGQFRAEATLGAWIKAIVVRKAYKHIQPRGFSPMYMELEAIQQPIDYDVFSGEYLEKALLNLPDGFRTVFVMAEIEGYTHREIAQLLGISEGTSKSQLFHAKKRLRQLLSHEK